MANILIDKLVRSMYDIMHETKIIRPTKNRTGMLPEGKKEDPHMIRIIKTIASNCSVAFRSLEVGSLGTLASNKCGLIKIKESRFVHLSTEKQISFPQFTLHN